MVGATEPAFFSFLCILLWVSVGSLWPQKAAAAFVLMHASWSKLLHALPPCRLRCESLEAWFESNVHFLTDFWKASARMGGEKSLMYLWFYGEPFLEEVAARSSLETF